MDVEKLIDRMKLDAADWAGDRYIKQDLLDSAEALTTLQAELEKVKAERDAAVEKLTLAVNQYRMETTGISLCGLCEYTLPPEEVFLLALAAGRKRTEC